jgi:hypothetical protein
LTEMKALHIGETSVFICQSTWHIIPGHMNLRLPRCWLASCRNRSCVFFKNMKFLVSIGIRKHTT